MVPDRTSPPQTKIVCPKMHFSLDTIRRPREKFQRTLAKPLARRPPPAILILAGLAPLSPRFPKHRPPPTKHEAPSPSLERGLSKLSARSPPRDVANGRRSFLSPRPRACLAPAPCRSLACLRQSYPCAAYCRSAPACAGAPSAVCTSARPSRRPSQSKPCSPFRLPGDRTSPANCPRCSDESATVALPPSWSAARYHPRGPGPVLVLGGCYQSCSRVKRSDTRHAPAHNAGRCHGYEDVKFLHEVLTNTRRSAYIASIILSIEPVWVRVSVPGGK